jgi:hypothetical protein
MLQRKHANSTATASGTTALGGWLVHGVPGVIRTGTLPIHPVSHGGIGRTMFVLRLPHVHQTSSCYFVHSMTRHVTCLFAAT